MNENTFCHQDEKELLEYKNNYNALDEELYNEDFMHSYYELEEEFQEFAKRHNVDMRLIDWLQNQ